MSVDIEPSYWCPVCGYSCCASDEWIGHNCHKGMEVES